MEHNNYEKCLASGIERRNTEIESLRKALSNALTVLEENAADECKFWGDDSPFAKDAVEIYEQAKAALSNKTDQQ